MIKNIITRLIYFIKQKKDVMKIYGTKNRIKDIVSQFAIFLLNEIYKYCNSFFVNNFNE